MNTPSISTRAWLTLPLGKWRIVMMLLCLLPFALAHSSQPVNPALASSTSKRTIMPRLKQRVIQLRDLSVKGFVPSPDFVNGIARDWSHKSQLDFAADQQLFKPVTGNTQDALLKHSPNYQAGLQVSGNARLECDVRRYWTASDRQEVAVKLGMHFGFR